MLGRIQESSSGTFSIGRWAAEEVESVQKGITQYLSRECSSQAQFQRRQQRTPRIEELLRCLLSLGFRSQHIKTLTRAALRNNYDRKPDRVHAVLRKLNNLGKMKRPDAVYVLGSNEDVLSYDPTDLQTPLQRAQDLVGLSPDEAATIIRSYTQFLLTYSNEKLVAVVEVLRGGYLLKSVLLLVTAC